MAILLAFVIFIVYHQYKILESRALAKVNIEELRKFYMLVSYCKQTKAIKEYIEQRLKRVRADALMEDEEYCNLVDVITTTYYQRFGLFGYSFETGV